MSSREKAANSVLNPDTLQQASLASGHQLALHYALNQKGEVMSNPYESNYGYEEDNFNQTCHCGAVFNVSVPGQKGHEESE